MATDTTTKTISLQLTVISKADEEICVDFYAVPKLAAYQIGEIVVDWGDSRQTSPDLTIDDETLNEMITREDLVPVSKLSHRYATAGKRTLTIKTPMGWLPLKSLPYQTISIDSPLPVLTMGETDGNFRLVASDTLPPVAVADSPDGKSRLAHIPSDLFLRNPQLEYFDGAFAGTQLKSIPGGLMNACRQLSSLVGTFAGTLIAKIEAQTFLTAGESTDCARTFADCPNLDAVENPFREGILPICMEEFLAGAPSTLFGWCAPDRREEMGWDRPKATANNPSFDFDWAAPDAEIHSVICFYPIDLALNGDILIDWGDGKAEVVDFNHVQTLDHAYAAAGLYRVKLHYTPREAVRPFYLGKHTKAIHTALPIWHPKTVETRGDFAGWAADLRELETIAAPIFVNNPDILNLEQAFAGCVKLKDVPHNILENIRHANVDGMFAFCKSLKQLPNSYTVLRRDETLDCFYPQLL